MQIALACVLTAGLMPYVWTAAAKSIGPRYDNRDVRLWQAGLTGIPRRAHACHLNSFEAFPLFAVAVLAALWRGAPAESVGTLAMVFTAARIAYGLAYIFNAALLRSGLWLLGMACVLRIFWMAL